jgi:hypothetical protein
MGVKYNSLSIIVLRCTLSFGYDVMVPRLSCDGELLSLSGGTLGDIYYII